MIGKQVLSITNMHDYRTYAIPMHKPIC